MDAKGEPARIRLRNGRALAFMELGDPAGRPVFYCHGLPGSRLEAGLAETAARRTAVRLIAIDRPGFGASDFQPGRRILDWAEDVAELAQWLGIERYAVLGVSGGGPYALACAYRLPERLTAVGVVAGLAPLDTAGASRGMRLPARLMLAAARTVPALLRTVLSVAAAPALQRDPQRVMKGIVIGSQPADRAVLRQPATEAVLSQSMRESVREGAAGAWWDLVLAGRPWGFAPRDVAMEVQLWHGEEDRTVPVSMGRWLAASLPRCRARFVPGEAHFSLPVLHMEDILRSLG